ncbi:MAG: hypothetical protein AB1505_23720 [Candidatus Latescibacterota bacterium]
MKPVARDPVLLVFCGLIALSVPTIAELVHHYPSVDARLRHARGLVPAPAVAELVQRAQEGGTGRSPRRGPSGLRPPA